MLCDPHRRLLLLGLAGHLPDAAESFGRTAGQPEDYLRHNDLLAQLLCPRPKGPITLLQIVYF